MVFERESGRTMIVLEQESFKIPKKILKLQGVNLKSEGVNLSSEGDNLCFLQASYITPRTLPKKAFVKKIIPKISCAKCDCRPEWDTHIYIHRRERELN